MSHDILDIVIAAALVIGGLFTLVGSIGLLKLQAPMARLHAPTKASTLGVGSILLASVLFAFASGAPSYHELLIIAFLFMTAPVSAYFIGKVHIHLGQNRKPLPTPARDRIWSTKAKREEDTPNVPEMKADA
ncbi:Na+/H+ antiporter subunit G [Alloyangia pacifica]|uniref:Na+/H+ antiporter subunit G n=1 Tax=Alloyangia pacifica TaxID=311180 RepID=A0A2U8HHU2_9RHOB|nr:MULTISPECIES: Na+/H+ antiporter subunit G [Roseobacteraceae]AWI85308.1 Na+/H+ antiporter subunit G [Alloyangia pacifica]NDV48541.1 Na+/H+ antiporter subunit G [Salipiger sp. PrR003]NDW35358.1 Na+/H+ antiporter subunit G [Salipiger sp. PrR007]